MGLIRHFFILNDRGSTIVVRGFLGEASSTVAEAFYQRVITEPPPPPVFQIENLNFAYIFTSSMYFVAVTPESMAPNVLLEILWRYVQVFSDYAGRASELTIQKNLALAYELVDEVLSFGCPQATDSSNLLHLVHNTVQYDVNFMTEFLQTDLFPGSGYDRPLALQVDQRSKTNNEIFLVIEEHMDLSLNLQGNILRSTITGIVKVKSFLQGQPSVLIQLDPAMCVASRQMQQNLPLKFDDIAFAPFVQTQSFDSDRSISFAPPDGENEILRYRASRPVQPPFRVSLTFETQQAKVVVARVSIQSTYPSELKGTNVDVFFQCPVEISNASCEIASSVASEQSSEFDHKKRRVQWRIKNFPGLTEYNGRFRFIFDDGIPAAAETLLGPISLHFNVDQLLPSGLSIKNFVASTSGTSNAPHRWIKTTAIGGNYIVNLL